MSNETLPLTCANHPNLETTLRCNRCEKPICARCAVLTPTGYRCRECVRGQQKTFSTTEWYDYPLAFSIAAILSYIGSQVASRIGFFTLLLAPVIGVIIAEAIRAVVKKRRSKRLFQVSALAAGLGAAPTLALYLLFLVMSLLQGSSGGFGLLFGIIIQAVYTFTVATTVYYRLSGIRL